MTEQYHDGNAMAGPLREVFAVDVTTATSRCVDCGRRNAVAALRVYLRAPGLVGRCPGCDAVTVRLVRTPGRAWLELRGALEIALPDSDGEDANPL
jgi:Family of unknown function (DUF6510)